MKSLFAQENYADEIAEAMEAADHNLLWTKENRLDNVRIEAVAKLNEAVEDFESLGMNKQANIVRYYLEILAANKETEDENEDDDEAWEDED